MFLDRKIQPNRYRFHALPLERHCWTKFCTESCGPLNRRSHVVIHGGASWRDVIR